MVERMVRSGPQSSGQPVAAYGYEAGALIWLPSAAWATALLQQIYRDPDYLDDPVLGDYLQAIWQPCWPPPASVAIRLPSWPSGFAES